jgi:hypothetical protein
VRTTLDIDDDVLRASREIARREKTTAGKVISALARRAICSPAPGESAPTEGEFLGFRPFGRRGCIVTNELVDRLREDGEY